MIDVLRRTGRSLNPVILVVVAFMSGTVGSALADEPDAANGPGQAPFLSLDGLTPEQLHAQRGQALASPAAPRGSGSNLAVILWDEVVGSGGARPHQGNGAGAQVTNSQVTSSISGSVR